MSVCDQKSPGSVVAHPYNTVKYVTCGTPITVELCEAGLVWRQELEKCVDPGAAGTLLVAGHRRDSLLLFFHVIKLVAIVWRTYEKRSVAPNALYLYIFHFIIKIYKCIEHRFTK